MSPNNEEFDMHIKEHITMELHKIPVPSIDEEWDKFKELLARRKNKPWFRTSEFLIAAVAIILIITGSLTLIWPTQANAFGERILQIINHIVGKTTQNKTQTITNNSFGTNTPMVQNLGDHVDKEITLEEAQKSVSFKIAEPKYLPSGTTIKKVSITNLSSDMNRITIDYLFQDQLIIFTQQNTSKTVSQGLLYDTDDTVAKDIMINGSPATLMTEKNGMKVLSWHQSSLLLQLKGQLPEEEFLKIAYSIS